MKIDEIKNDYNDPSSPGLVITQYKFGMNSSLSVSLYQDAALDLSRAADKGFLDRGGAKGWGESVRQENDSTLNENVLDGIPIEGINDWAVFGGRGGTSVLNTTANIYRLWRLFYFINELRRPNRKGFQC